MRDWSLLTLLVLATTVPAGILSALVVISESDQAVWVTRVLDAEIGMIMVFFVIPALIGFAAAWTARRRGTQTVAAVALGSLAPPLVLALLSAVATAM